MKRLLFMLCLLVAPETVNALPVSLSMTLPLYNASPSAICTPSLGDTVRDLSNLYIWAQQATRSDSALVAILGIAGKQGKDITITVDRPIGLWNFWVVTSRSNGNKSCNSNIIQKNVSLEPGPSPAILR